VLECAGVRKFRCVWEAGRNAGSEALAVGYRGGGLSMLQDLLAMRLARSELGVGGIKGTKGRRLWGNVMSFPPGVSWCVILH